MDYQLRKREIELTQEEEQERLAEQRKNKDFVMVFDEVGTAALQSVALKSGQAMALFLWLAKNMDSKGAIIVANSTLAEALQIPANNISRSLKILRDKGVIYTLSTGGSNIHCVNPDIAWRSTETGKKYALFYARVLVSENEITTAQANAERNRKAAAEGMQLRTIRGKVLLPKQQREFAPPVGQEPAREIDLTPE